MTAALWFPQSVGAKTILFQDDFSGSLDKWQQVRPQAQAWEIRSGAAYVKISQPFKISELVPRADLWNPDWHSIRFELAYTPLRGTDRNISFHFQDLNNWYEFHFTNSTMTVLHLDNGAVAWSRARPFQLQNGQTYHLELRLHEQTITLFIDGLLVAAETDPTFQQDYGRIGLKAGTGADAPTEVQIDSVQVSEYSSTDLGVYGFKQTDQTWAADEYDSATSWADETGIDAWGCALTSLTMIFRYYGISRLPDGTPLTPQSFNAWLKLQPDGYIGEGLVNWQAGLRVARASHEQFGTPLLAYKKVTDGWEDTLQTELSSLRPAIIQLPGHFVVAEGIASTEPFDVAISDPAFAYTRLSEHSEQPVSVRTFAPTVQTKPTITVLSKPEVQVELSGTNTTATQTVDQLQAGIASSSPFRLTELGAASSGEYVLKVASQLFQPANVSIYAYDQLIEPLAQELLTHIVGPNGIRYLLTMDESSQTMSIQPTSSFGELIADVAPLRGQGLLPTLPALQLEEVFITAELLSDQTDRYRALGTQITNSHKSQTDDLAIAYLLQQLALIE